MSTIIKKSSIIRKIEKALDKYEKILIFDSSDQQVKALLESFSKKIILGDYKRTILVINNGYTIESGNEIFENISNEEYEELCKIYSMYEFSNRILFVSKSNQYGSILNYLSMELVTEEEFFEALLN